jgi:hypothetical protein
LDDKFHAKAQSLRKGATTAGTFDTVISLFFFAPLRELCAFA